MAILIDPPLWPAHGTLWSHLVSDQSYDELHEFARLVPIPRRGFDLDHYDVPTSLYARAIELGAIPVDPREVVRGLQRSGLRVRSSDRQAARPTRRIEYLRDEWRRLSARPGLESVTRDPDAWQRLGAELLGRWGEPHRHYHDVSHLEDVLLSLDQLAVRGERIEVTTLLAAWFHDAVYEGASGTDEAESARLAVGSFATLGIDPEIAREVSNVVISTTPEFAGREAPLAAAHLLDADLSILGAGEPRYLRYAEAVRLEYGHVPESAFRSGRAEILSRYLELPSIFRTDAARDLWESRARINLASEVSRLRIA